MALFKSIISSYATNKIGGFLDSGANAISGIIDPTRKKFTGNGRLMYPIDLIGNPQYGEFIKFTPFQMLPKKKKKKDDNPPKIEVNKIVSTPTPNDVPSLRDIAIGDFQEKDFETQKKADDNIYLYVPAAAMINSSTIDWETKETSSLARADFSSLSAGTKSALGIGSDMWKKAAKGIGGKVFETIEKENQSVFSANIESFFTGMGLRKWNFQFEFAPRSEAELKMALSICRRFKEYSLPSRPKGSEHTFEYPSAWAFSVHDKDGKLLKLMGCEKCYITSITTNMAPDSVWSTFNDGNPTIFTLTFGLTEDTILDRTKYKGSGYEL